MWFFLLPFFIAIFILLKEKYCMLENLFAFWHHGDIFISVKTSQNLCFSLWNTFPISPFWEVLLRRKSQTILADSSQESLMLLQLFCVFLSHLFLFFLFLHRNIRANFPSACLLAWFPFFAKTYLANCKLSKLSSFLHYPRNFLGLARTRMTISKRFWPSSLWKKIRLDGREAWQTSARPDLINAWSKFLQSKENLICNASKLCLCTIWIEIPKQITWSSWQHEHWIAVVDSLMAPSTQWFRFWGCQVKIGNHGNSICLSLDCIELCETWSSLHGESLACKRFDVE